MAYGNWGAYVYRHGERQRDREDATPYQEIALPPGYWQAFASGRADGSVNPHHAVLGGGRIRWCGHKSEPVLYLDGVRMDGQEMRRRYATHLEQDEEGYLWETEETIYQGEIEGYRFRAIPFNGNMLDLELIDADGTLWQARAGYAFGAGYQEDSEGNSAYQPYPFTGPT